MGKEERERERKAGRRGRKEVVPDLCYMSYHHKIIN